MIISQGQDNAGTHPLVSPLPAGVQLLGKVSQVIVVVEVE